MEFIKRIWFFLTIIGRKNMANARFGVDDSWQLAGYLSTSCPYPIKGDFTADQCIRNGHCGCRRRTS